MTPRKTPKRSRIKSTPAKRAVKKAPSGPGPLRRWWDSLGGDARKRLGLTVLNILVVCIVILLAAGGLYRLNDMLVRSGSGLIAEKSEARIYLDNPPVWMTESLAAAIIYDLTDGAMVESYDSKLAERIGQRALGCPWISALHNVSVDFPDLDPNQPDKHCEVRLLADYRYPVAIVEDERNWAYLDGMGCVLPADQSDQLRSGMHTVRIMGVARSLPAIGQILQGDDVTAALTLADILSRKPYHNEITVIDVRNYNFRQNFSSPQIIIHAVSGQYVTEIRFGAFPIGGLPPAGEPTVDQKISNLDKWFIQNNNFISGPAFLDLRYPDNVVVPSTY